MKKLICILTFVGCGIFCFAQQQSASISMISVYNTSATPVTVALLESDAEILVVIKNVDPGIHSVMQFVGLTSPEFFMVFIGAYSQVLTPDSKCVLEPGHKYSFEYKGVGTPAQLIDLGTINN